MKQQSFWNNPKESHGGLKGVGRRKGARPIVTKSPMHITLKSSRARGAWSFLRHKKEIACLVNNTAKKFRVRVRLYQNVGNHLHIAAQAASRHEFQNFLRVLPQAIAFAVTGTRKGSPVGKFWDALAHTRVIHWGKDWLGIREYFFRNQVEGAGVPREIIDRWAKETRAKGSGSARSPTPPR